MSDPIESFARRVAGDPFFLAPALALYAASEELDGDAALAASLGCPLDQLNHMRICRMPREQSAEFRADEEKIAAHTGADAEKLEGAVRRGQVLLKLKQSEQAAGTLLAAREREPEGEP